jgi:hypothetical protein
LRRVTVRRQSALGKRRAGATADVGGGLIQDRLVTIREHRLGDGQQLISCQRRQREPAEFADAEYVDLRVAL